MYGLIVEPLETLYKIAADFILLGVQLLATARARVRYITIHRMAPGRPTTISTTSIPTYNRPENRII